MTHYTLTDLLSEQSVSVALSATTKGDCIHELVACIEKTGRISDAASVQAALLAREHNASTAIEGGIALPHIQSAYAKAACMAFGISRNGIAFSANDGELTHFFALAVAPEADSASYLTTLVELIDKLRNNSVQKKLFACKTNEELYKRLLGYEHVMVPLPPMH